MSDYIDLLAGLGTAQRQWDLTNIVEVSRPVWDELLAVVRAAEATAPTCMNNVGPTPQIEPLCLACALAALKAKVEAMVTA